jgi:hypothetical protein
MKERAWLALCFVLGAIGYGSILAINGALAAAECLRCEWARFKGDLRAAWDAPPRPPGGSDSEQKHPTSQPAERSTPK